MKLSDIMSAAGLGFFAEVALALFVLSFALVALTVVWRANQATWERARWLPLDEGPNKGPSKDDLEPRLGRGEQTKEGA